MKNSQFVVSIEIWRYAVADNHLEHFMKPLDAGSRRLFILIEQFGQYEVCGFVLIVAKNYIAVDSAAIAAFAKSLGGIRDVVALRAAFRRAGDAAVNILQAYDQDPGRPRAYYPWGRGLPHLTECDLETRASYQSKREALICKLQLLLENHKKFRITYGLDPSYSGQDGVCSKPREIGN
jgi:hypothetical protein